MRIQLLSLLFLVGLSITGADELNWQMAPPVKETGSKLRLVWFHAQWCGPCKQMEKEGFSDAGIKGLMSQYSLHDLDEAKPEAVQFGKDYRIRGFPSLLVLNSDGKELRRGLGYGGLESLREFLQKGLTGADLLDELRAEVSGSAGKISTDSILNFANTLLDRGQFDEVATTVRNSLSDPMLYPIASDLRGIQISATRMQGNLKLARTQALAYFGAARSDAEASDAIWHIGRIAKENKQKIDLFPYRHKAWARFPDSLSLARDVVRDAPKQKQIDLADVRDKATRLLRLADTSASRDRLQSVLADLLIETKQWHDAHRLIEELAEKHPTEEFYKQKLERYRKEYPLS